MTKAYIKICGVKDIKIAKHAINCGASFLGFVFFKNSSRHISISKCTEILDEINGNVIGIWLAKINNESALPIVGSGDQKRDFIHVFDLVDGIIKIGFSDEKHPDAWELGTGVNYSINELFKMFQDKFNCKSVYIPDQKGNPKKTLRENDDMLSKLNWCPKDRLKNYIKQI